MTDFKSMCDDLLDQYHTKQIRKNDITGLVCKEFNIVPKTFRTRFKSMFGKSLTEYCEDLVIPPRSLVVSSIMQSDSVSELWDILPMPKHYRKRVFMDTFGVSTFARAKARLLLEVPHVEYDPSIEENRSLVISQVLGDGSYCKDRCALRIQHGIKQLDYAVYKAALFNKAFPETSPAGTTKVITHTQGHKYSSWYSRRLPTKISTYLADTELCDMLEYLTPKGFFLWFMDDGYSSPDGVVREMYIHNNDLAIATVQYLSEYGIKASFNANNNVMSVKDMVNSVMFFKNFIEPFKESLPECMHYKTNIKI